MKSTVFISEDADLRIIEYIKALGSEVCLIRHGNAVDPAVSAHPDIYMCKLGADPKAPVFFGNADELGKKYPNDVRFNAVVCGHYLIGRLDALSSNLISSARMHDEKLKLIDVPQGYTKCNLAVLDDSHLITEDFGIYKVLSSLPDIRCFLVEAKHVRLKGYDHGFIGGATGRIGNRIIFSGDLSLHPDGEIIKEYIRLCGLFPVDFPGLPLTDIGSIIEEIK